MRQLCDPCCAAPETDLAASPTLLLLAAADEEAREGRVFRVAVAAAVVFHLLLALVPLPKVAAMDASELPKEHLVVVQTPRFKPPVIQPEQPISERRPFVVPVPNPTPDKPEPIRPLQVVALDVEVPEIALVDELLPLPPIDDGRPIVIGGAVIRPVPIDAPQPIYPEIARRAHIQGVVLLNTILDQTGRVTDVKVVKDLPFGLGEAAATAVERWRYRPATLNGNPVAVYLQVTVTFTLQ